MLDVWAKAVAPMMEPLKAGDSVTATKRLVGVVNGSFGGDFDSLPADLRQRSCSTMRGRYRCGSRRRPHRFRATRCAR